MVFSNDLLPGGVAEEESSAVIEENPSTHEDVSAETKLNRFLLHGKLDLPVGELKNPSSISENDLISLKNVIREIDVLKLFDTLSFFHDKGWTSLRPLPETIPFVLALTSKLHLRRTLKIAEKILNPDEFLLFVKDCVETSPFSMVVAYTEFIQNFYARYDYNALAKMVAGVHYQGWSHSRIMKLGNVTSDDPFVDAVLEYAYRGPAALRCREDYAAETVRKYFTAIEDFRMIKDSEDALHKIVDHRECFGSSKQAILHDKNVVEALVDRVDLKQLLMIFDVISGTNFDENSNENIWEERIVQIFASLKSPNGQIHPTEWFLSEQRYWYKKGEAFFDEAAKKQTPPPYPFYSDKVLDALENNMEKALENLIKIDLDIRIVIQPFLFPCVSGGFVHGDKAAALIAYVLKKTGRNVSVFTFEGTKPVEITESKLVPLALETWISTPMDSESMANFVRNSSTDMVVVIGSSLNPEDFINVVNGRKRFSKLVVCNLSDSDVQFTCDHDDILVTSGFHKNLCDVITAFAILNFNKLHQP